MQHCVLSPSKRQVTILGSIVEPAAHIATIDIAKIAHRSGIGSQPAGHDSFRFSMALQGSLHERQSCSFVTFLRNIALKNLAFVIDSTPQIVRLAVDFYEHLVKVPAPLATACSRLTRCRRISAAKIGPNLFHHKRMVS